MLEKYRIQDCVVKLDRLNEESIPKVTQKFHLKPTGTVHSNSSISWFPALSTIQRNSVDARLSLAVYQNKNHVVKKLVGRSECI